jgi:hypothetical protein
MTALSAVHRRRLREVWRSAGWPCHDLIELDLLAAGLIERVRQPSGHETLRVTDAGVVVLAETRLRNQQALSDTRRSSSASPPRWAAPGASCGAA